MSDLPLLLKLNRPVPRYTSYPTAPQWMALSEDAYNQKLKDLATTDKPLSLYVHIPFCKSMCLYCGCSVVLNRKAENEERYVNYLIQEIEMVARLLGEKKRAVQVHFGGGTPTKLAIDQIDRIVAQIEKYFDLKSAEEVAMEIDPRTVVEDNGAKLRFLKERGFNRVSFGVQDTNPKVQEAVKRRQSLEMTIETYALAKELRFKGINIDLIYGLPYQTEASFAETVSHILRMRPDRIAFFSYAKVPWLKLHQKAIPDHTLPSLEEKFTIYAAARSRFVENGYCAIGMDHFALEEDELAVGYREKRLQRNFQGYSLKCTEDMLGFGVTSIGYVQGAYIQNIKELPAYYSALECGRLPLHRGLVLTEEDLLRKWVINTLMCDFALDKKAFQKRFLIPFDVYFNECRADMRDLIEDGLLIDSPEKLIVTPLGELFVRIIASTFDAYYEKAPLTNKYSQSV